VWVFVWSLQKSSAFSRTMSSSFSCACSDKHSNIHTLKCWSQISRMRTFIQFVSEHLETTSNLLNVLELPVEFKYLCHYINTTYLLLLLLTHPYLPLPSLRGILYPPAHATHGIKQLTRKLHYSIAQLHMHSFRTAICTLRDYTYQVQTLPFWQDQRIPSVDAPWNIPITEI
jgi:hypothetical protein